MTIVARRTFTVLALSVLAVAFPAVVFSPNELGLITGGSVAHTISSVSTCRGSSKQRAPAMTLNVYPSKGSVDNIYAVYQRPGHQIGIVQSDVLRVRVPNPRATRPSDASRGR